MFKNILANFFGKFASILSGYLFIPLYIRYLGIENYAIISFSLVVLGIISLIDSGLTTTITREFAKKKGGSERKLRVLSSLESIYWSVAITIYICFFFLSPSISRNFINSDVIPHETIVLSLRILGLTSILHIISNFYIGGLVGLEHQVDANLFQITWSLIKNGVVIFIIIYYPSLILFFSWQAVVTIIYIIIIRRFLLLKLSTENRNTSRLFKIDKEILMQSSKFTGGMFLISLIAIINTQLDKLLISNLLPIKELGYYTIAVTLAQILIVAVSPFATATLPRLTALVSEMKTEETNVLFFRIFRMVTLLIVSITFVLLLFSEQLLLLWTGDKEIVSNVSSYVHYLLIGSAMLALQVIPFNIAIANGYTRFNNILGIVSLFVVFPLYWFAIKNYGPTGAAASWMIIQIVIAPIYIELILKKFVRNTFMSVKFFFKVALLTVVFFSSFYIVQSFVIIYNNTYDLITITTTFFLILILNMLIIFPPYERRKYFREALEYKTRL